MAELNFNTEEEWYNAHYNAHEQGETAQAEFESNYGIDWASYQVKSQ